MCLYHILWLLLFYTVCFLYIKKHVCSITYAVGGHIFKQNLCVSPAVASDMARLILLALCSLLFFTAAVNPRVLEREKPDKGNIYIFNFFKLTNFSTFAFDNEWKISITRKGNVFVTVIMDLLNESINGW